MQQRSPQHHTCHRPPHLHIEHARHSMVHRKPTPQKPPLLHRPSHRLARPIAATLSWYRHAVMVPSSSHRLGHHLAGPVTTTPSILWPLPSHHQQGATQPPPSPLNLTMHRKSHSHAGPYTTAMWVCPPGRCTSTTNVVPPHASSKTVTIM